MFNKRKKKKNVDFLLQSSHYRRLHLYLYFLSLTVIVLIYFFIIMIFSESSFSVIMTSIVSLLVGVYLIFNRDMLVKKISDKLEDKKRKKLKIGDKSGLKTTLRRISPKNRNLKLNIKGKVSIKEHFNKLKKRISKNKVDQKKKKPDYIEFE